MKSPQAVTVCAALVVAGIAVLWWRSDSRSAIPDGTASTSPAATTDEDPPPATGPADDARDAANQRSRAAVGGAGAPVERPEPAGGAVDATSSGDVIPWPVVHAADTSSESARATGEPGVAVELAFRALRYVGADPEAEKTWRRAIDDPRTPASARSDLIEDLNDEGYTDNSHPTDADLQLILARLELIERLAPHAIDEVNAAAFEEAYKDLLNMYLTDRGETAGGSMIVAAEALERLRNGNRRFVEDVRGRSAKTGQTRRNELVDGQEPFAIILGCSDSRVPAEIVFDQGLGDLFVIRVAGNIVAPSQVGSVEFAAERFHTRLVVVMGHSMCGAVLAAVEELERPTESRSPNLRSIVDRVRPSVEPLMETDLCGDRDALVRRAVRANIRSSADHLRHGSEILERMIARDGLVVVGAEYSLETGEVEFFDGVP